MVFPESYKLHTVRRVIVIISSLLKHNGTLWTVKYLKQVRLHVTRYMCGQPLTHNQCMVGLTDGFPTKFLFLKKLVDSGKTSDIKFCLTLLCLSRTLLPSKGEEIPVSLETITKPSSRTKRYTIPSGFVRKFVNDFKLKHPKVYASEKDFYLSTKSGPQGSTLLTVTRTILCMSYSQLDLLCKLTTWARGSDFSEFYTWCWNNQETIFSGPKKPLVTGRLSIVDDPECKKRVIAMSDYLTQFALRPINDVLFKKLKNMPCDRTYTQDPHITGKTDSDHFWSLDLTAATDRFPLSLQQKLLGFCFQDSVYA